MASAASASERRMSIGRVFNRAFAALGANAGTMFGIAFLFSALPIAVLNLWQAGLGPTRDFGTNAVLIGGIYLASFVLTQLAQGGLVRATIAHSDHRTVSFAACVATGARFALLPPDNSTGNFVKVTQRVPVKIVLNKEDPEHPLRAGMSVNAIVAVK